MADAKEAFLAWHQGEMAKLAATLTYGAGGMITVPRQALEDVMTQRLQVSEDRATGSTIYVLENVE